MSIPASTTAWLSAAAHATPDALALVAGPLRLTYRHLAGAAQRWRDHLDDIVPATEPAVIAVVARRTAQSVAQLWAAWESPHAVLVVDPASPAAADDRRLEAWGVHTRFAGEDATTLGKGVAADSSHHSWILTSGSSGAPRAVILTHGNVAAAVAASQRRLGNDAADRWQLALPLAHVGGASVLWRCAAAGSAVVLDERFGAERTAQRLADGAITVTSVVPTMLRRLVDEVEEVSGDVRAVLVGGAAAGDSLIGRALDAGLPVITTYGLTEAGSQVATVAPGRMHEALGTVGTPLDGMAVTIDASDDTGVGVISVEGPAVSPGYVGEPARTGPLRTGDLGAFDAAGRLIVHGRHDDVIVTGGVKVVPAVVERALESLSHVRQAAVVGIRDDEWGEAVVAYVVAEAGTDPAALAAHVHPLLRAAERPKRYVLLEALPVLTNGKVDRGALVQQLVADL